MRSLLAARGGHREMVLDLFDDLSEGGRIISRVNSVGEERCLGCSRRGLVNRWVRDGRGLRWRCRYAARSASLLTSAIRLNSSLEEL